MNNTNDMLKMIENENRYGWVDVTGFSSREALLVSNRLYSLDRTECDMKSTDSTVLPMDIDINKKNKTSSTPSQSPPSALHSPSRASTRISALQE
jgi:hypothetical protein